MVISMTRDERIIENKDTYELLVSRDDFEFILVKLVYSKYINIPFKDLNYTQRVLFLCMRLEDCCQVDSIYRFIEDGLAFYIEDTVKAFEQIGANETAVLMRRLAEILPKAVLEGDENAVHEFLFHCDDVNLKIEIDKIDAEISDYPDGALNDLYYEYAYKHREDIFDY